MNNRTNTLSKTIELIPNEIFQVIAFTCGLIVVVLMFLSLISTDWLMAEGWRQGLFVHCIAQDAVQPLPFNVNDPPGCYASLDFCEY